MANDETKTKIKSLSKFYILFYVISAALIAIGVWHVWNIIYRDVGPLPDPQITLNAAKNEAAEYKDIARNHAEATKERSVSIYVQTAKDTAIMAPDAIADGVVSELRIFAAELAGTDGSDENSLSGDRRISAGS